MDLFIKQSIRIISLQFEDGIKWDKLLIQLNQSINYWFDSDLLLQRLKNTEGITINQGDMEIENDKDGVFLYACQEFIDHYNQLGILRSFLVEDESARIVENIYKIIVKSGSKGINYADIALKFKKLHPKDKKLDSQMVSHHCRRLYDIQMVHIEYKNNCKQVIAKHLNVSKCSKPSVEKEQIIQSYNGNDKVQEAYQQINQESFLFRELTLQQNLELILSSADSFQKEGLGINDICVKLSKYEQKKALSKILSEIKKDLKEQYDYQMIPHRQGKVFSYKYLLKTNKMIQMFNKKQETSEQQNTLDEDILHQNQKNEPQQQIKQEIIINQNNKQNFDKSLLYDEKLKMMIQKCQEQKNQQQERPILNQDSFDHYRDFHKNNQDTHKFLKSALNSYQRSQDFFERYIINKENIDQSHPDYNFISDCMLKILLENVQFDENLKNQSKNKATSQKINRYIFIMNEMYEEQVLAKFFVRNLILNKEKNLGAGKIDRKTLNSILHTLESTRLLQQINREFVFTSFLKINEVKNVITYKNVEQQNRTLIDNHVKLVQTMNIQHIQEALTFKQFKELDFQPTQQKQIKNKSRHQSVFEIILNETDQENKEYINSRLNLKSCKVSTFEYRTMVFAQYFQKLVKVYTNRLMYQFLLNLKSLMPDENDKAIQKNICDNPKSDKQMCEENLNFFIKNKFFKSLSYQSNSKMISISFDTAILKIDHNLQKYDMEIETNKNESNQFQNYYQSSNLKYYEDIDAQISLQNKQDFINKAANPTVVPKVNRKRIKKQSFDRIFAFFLRYLALHPTTNVQSLKKHVALDVNIPKAFKRLYYKDQIHFNHISNDISKIIDYDEFLTLYNQVPNQKNQIFYKINQNFNKYLK